MTDKMMRKVVGILVAAIFMSALMVPSRAAAIEVKKMIGGGDSGGGGGGGGGGGSAAPNPMSKAQQQALSDAVSNDSEQFVDQESEKKSSGDAYVDLEHAKPHIFPSGSNVTVKLQAASYKAKAKRSSEQKSLVFKYKAQGGKYVLDGDPTWEGVAAAKTK
jgi:hypothetical protein